MSYPRAVIYRANLSRLLLLGPALMTLAALYAYPFSRMLWLSFFDPQFTLRHYLEFFREASYVRILLNTFRMSVEVTILCLLLGYPVAYFLVHVRPRLCRWCILLVLLPFWISPLVRTYSWMTLLGREGIINNALIKLHLIGAPLKIMYTGVSVRIGMVYIMLPYMILSLYSIMKGIDKSLIRASESLGARPGQAFVKVFLPLSYPGIVAGSLLIFILSLGFYLTPALLGGLKDVTIAMTLDTQVNELLNWGLASAMGFVLLVVTTFLYVIYLNLPGVGRIWGAQ